MRRDSKHMDFEIVRESNWILKFNSRLLFKLLMYCSAGFCIPISLLIALLALFDVVPATLNDKPYYGLKGFLISIFFAPMFVLLTCCTLWLMLGFGLKVSKLAMTFLNMILRKKV